jgi:mono/diheme cytochrome c family protein
MKEKCAAVGIGILVTLLAVAPTALAQSASQIKRGEYLAAYGGCDDCHTPKVMTPNGPAPDKTRLLSGHPADSQVPPVPPGVVGAAPNQWAALANSDFTAWAGPWGISFAANLTPDKATGLGGWTADQFIKTIRTGKHLGVGRPLLPPMPWFDITALSDADLRAIFAYLRSLKPIENPVPVPVPPKS